ncbi:MAG TPA: DNA ligase D [Acidobacteriaceae bacterium]
MTLSTYRDKRNFEQTSEPPPKPEAAAKHKGLVFVVQKHDASRLHYDLRLEMQGVLKSWAVPKGPSMNPEDKRLAMKVEDHPFEYGSFEGTIPKGNYGAGTVEIWDRGEFIPVGTDPPEKQLEKGDLKFALKGERLRGEFALVKIKKKEKHGEPWLLIKHRDAFSTDAPQEAEEDWNRERERKAALKQASTQAAKQPAEKSSEPKPLIDLSRLPGARATPFLHNPALMLATPATTIPKDKGWLFEIKWDGIRALCLVQKDSARFKSRNGIDLTSQFPELQQLKRDLRAKSAILDGEIVIFDEAGRSDFQALQPRIMAVRTASGKISRRPHDRLDATLLLFDILFCDGYDLRDVRIEERKEVLASVLRETAQVRLSTHIVDHGDELLAMARQNGLEGILAKRTGSHYEPRRSGAWQKIKLVGEQDCVICGYTQGKRSTFGGLLLGVYEDGHLRYCGNVGTGFDERQQHAILEALQPYVTTRSPFEERLELSTPVTWVAPRVVCRVRYTHWTRDHRLRAPVYLGLRLDLPPEQCMPEPLAQAATGAAVPPARPANATAGDSVSRTLRARGPKPPPVRQRRQPELGAALDLGTRDNATVQVDGRTLKLTHIKKVYFPDDGYTKGELLAYYAEIAPVMLPHLKGRPLSLRRYPNGIAEPAFFQKDAARGIPEWIQGATPEDPETKYIVCENRAGLLFLTNLGCVDHNPWMSRLPSIQSPDYILLDIDPYQCPYEMVTDAALKVRKILDEIEIVSYPKTSGGDGFHVYIPIAPGASYGEARGFAELLASAVVRRHREIFTTPRSVNKRQPGRVYFDYLQIGEGRTIAAPYSVRAHPHAPVSTPLHWREVTKRLRPDAFTMKTLPKRIDKFGDLFAEVLEGNQSCAEAEKRLRNSLPRLLP